MRKTAVPLLSFLLACYLGSLLHAQTPPPGGAKPDDAALLLSLRDGRAETVVVCHRTYLKVRSGGRLGSLQLLTPDPSKPIPAGAVDIQVGVREQKSLWVQALIANQPAVTVLSPEPPVPQDVLELQTRIGRVDASIRLCQQPRCSVYCGRPRQCCEYQCAVELGQEPEVRLPSRP